MLKKVIFTGLIITILLVWGMTEKKTYTDITKNGGWIQGAEVASNGNIADECVTMKEELPKAPIICKVKIIDDVEIVTNAGKQKVIIEDVYKGDVCEGDEVYLYTGNWRVVLPRKSSKSKANFLNIVKTNIPKVGKEYLVFASETVREKKETLLILFQSSDVHITPVFCCEDSTNIVVMPDGHDGTAVSYEMVKDNEFILPTEEDLKYMEETKKFLLEYFIYGREKECF